MVHVSRIYTTMKSKSLVFIFFIVILSITSIGSFFFLSSKKASLAVKNSEVKRAVEDSITISPQNGKDTVIVDSAILTKNGFLVVRQIDNGQLGQVIEISSPLNAGTHKNITISLGNADIKNTELIVMIYDDYANDGFFNDFDMPTLNENGNMIGNYLSTGKPLPVSITEGENTAMQGMNMQKSMTKIIYTDKGFVPNKVEVSVGSMVEFVNDSNTDMWVASNPHPQHTDLPTFDQFRPYKQHSIYRYTFTKKGVWGFHDHLNASRNGTVTVN